VFKRILIDHTQLIFTPLVHHLLHCHNLGLHGRLILPLVLAQTVPPVIFHGGSIYFIITFTLVVDIIHLNGAESTGKNRSYLAEAMFGFLWLTVY
jgi:hypothetical protein